MGTRRLVLLRSSLLIAALALSAGAPAASAQDPLPGLPAVYGGGSFAGPAKADELRTTRIGIRRAGADVTVRLSVAVPCRPFGGKDHRGSDVVVHAAVNPDGTFHAHGAKATTTGELGRVLLTVDGTLTATRADGTARIRSSMHCGEQVRPWSARPVDVKVPLQGAPAPVDGVLYGVTTTSGDGVPHGVVAEVSGGGRQLRVATSYPDGCKGRDRKGAYHFSETIQYTFRPLTIAGGAVSRHVTAHESAADRRRGVKGTIVSRLDAGFAGPALTGSYSWSKTYSKGKERERCSAPKFGFVAVP